MMNRANEKPQPKGELVLQCIPLSRDTNANGDVYAGWLVQQMDLAAGASANRLARGRTATVAMDRMEFLSPVRVGSEVQVFVQVQDIGRSSMKLHVEVWTRDPTATTNRKVTEAQLVFVAIDEKGRIREVPDSARA